MKTIEQNLKSSIIQAFQKQGLNLVEHDIVIDKSKDPKFGDYASNVCLKYAKVLNVKPVTLANSILTHIHDPMIQKIEVAGPGFLNFFIKSQALSEILSRILKEGPLFGKSQNYQGKTLNRQNIENTQE